MDFESVVVARPHPSACLETFPNDLDRLMSERPRKCEDAVEPPRREAHARQAQRLTQGAGRRDKATCDGKVPAVDEGGGDPRKQHDERA